MADALTHPASGAASAWVRRFAPLIPAGEVLDLACGNGRHAHLLAALGHPVLALDRDTAALATLAADAAVARLAAATGAVATTAAQGTAAGGGTAILPAPITTMPFDLERDPQAADWPFAPGRFAAIVVTNYLHRQLFPHLVAALRPDGLLIYETFAAGNARFGKPSNPDFLLRAGELLALPLQVLAYEHGYASAPRPAMVQRLCAAGPAFAAENAVLSRA
jgi:SAM-dependent methyltransferase